LDAANAGAVTSPLREREAINIFGEMTPIVEEIPLSGTPIASGLTPALLLRSVS